MHLVIGNVIGLQCSTATAGTAGDLRYHPFEFPVVISIYLHVGAVAYADLHDVVLSHPLRDDPVDLLVAVDRQDVTPRALEPHRDRRLRLGAERAKRMLFTGDLVDGREAARLVGSRAKPIKTLPNLPAKTAKEPQA